ncbi:hypothetical protein [Nannocystis pusilla]|uniref:hypothetical protein n=1 Tax=Nannocystis pusilla TaxID=889268 RepID=UPI003B81A980
MTTFAGGPRNVDHEPRIGGPAERIDARIKVTGQARYTADVALPGLAHAALVDSPVACGRILAIDTAHAEQAAGVLLILTHHNRGPLGDLPNGDATGLTADPRPPLADDRIHYRGQPVAMVVAESPEQAAHAAALVEVFMKRPRSWSTSTTARAPASPTRRAAATVTRPCAPAR